MLHLSKKIVDFNMRVLKANTELCKERNTLRRKYKYIFLKSKYKIKKMRYKIYFCVFRVVAFSHVQLFAKQQDFYVISENSCIFVGEINALND
jgi:hypothetical protein